MGAQTAGHKPRGRKQNSSIYDAFYRVLLEIWIKLVTSFWRRNSAAMVPQSAPPGLHPLVRARMNKIVSPVLTHGHMAVSTLFVTTTSAEAPNGTILSVICVCSSPPCPKSSPKIVPFSKTNLTT